MPFPSVRVVPSRLWLLVVLVGFAAADRTSVAQAPGSRPCDLLAATPCVAAISTTRALVSGYTGPLYQVTRESDNKRHDVGLLPDGYVDADAQDTFCANTRCAITRLYDQSPNHNDLTPAPRGQNGIGAGPNGSDVPARAKVLAMTVAGHKAYGVEINPGMGYRNDHTRNIAVKGQPEGVYMVTSALHLNSLCCFDFGNAETSNNDDGAGRMDSINIRYGTGTPVGIAVNLDLENGLVGGLHVPTGTPFVTAIGTNDGHQSFALFQGNAQSGELTTTGPRPLGPKYHHMDQEGAILLGIGGDNSNKASGYFFEGVMTQGTPTVQTLQAVQSNIVAAHYAGQLKP